MHYVYIIESLKDGGYYIGFASNLEKRLAEHNKGKTRSIKSRLPFKLVYFEKHQDKREARKRELFLKKSGQQREIVKKLISESNHGPIV